MQTICVLDSLRVCEHVCVHDLVMWFRLSLTKLQ